MNVVFVGETWLGSNARSLCSAILRMPNVDLCEISENSFCPRYKGAVLRVLSRCTLRHQRKELAESILRTSRANNSQVALVYKGFHVGEDVVQALKRQGVTTVNYFPDANPFAHGSSLRTAVGAYDLVISAKNWHPSFWREKFGYTNKCLSVPHGYDPDLHLWDCPSAEHATFDIVLCATWRPQYDRIMSTVAVTALRNSWKVAIAGSGWEKRKHNFPSSWSILGERTGRSYGAFLRSGKITIAPIDTEAGDSDTARTYELPAMMTCALHQRTPLTSNLFAHGKETLLWSNPDELVEHLRDLLANKSLPTRFALESWRRAVPSFSVSSRASDIFTGIREFMSTRVH